MTRRTGMEDSQASQGKVDLGLGQRALERGFIGPEHLQEALAEQARGTTLDGLVPPKALGEILIEKGYITRFQYERLSKEPEPAQGTTRRTKRAAAGDSGKRLGKYLLGRELGRGGMGVVVEAVDTQLNRRVALKLLVERRHLSAEERAAEDQRFLREAQMCAKLNHPNIVTVFEAGVEGGRRLLAMGLVEGLPLTQWREKTSPTIRQVATLIRNVALAVQHAHDHGILHRDLKPANVLVDASGRPFVGDFGLAKVSEKEGSSQSGAGTVAGTPSYMSPEQALGRQSEVREASDVYSLGATLYFLLTGRPPFDAGSVVKTCLAVVHDRLVPPSKHNRTVSPDLERVVLRAMSKDATRRYPSARALAEDLDRYLQGTPVLSDEELRFTTGLAALHAGHLEEAVDMFKDLLRHDPAGREPSEARARLIRDLRETEEALTLALDSQPKNHEIRANRGAYRFARAILASLGGGDPLPDCALALEDFGRALEGRPEHVNSRVSRANILTFQARFGRNSGKETASVFKRALDDLEIALRHDEGCSAAWHNRGMVHFYLGRDARKGAGEPTPHYERAIADFQRGAELAPGYAYLFKDLGVVKVALGKLLAPKGGARVEELFREAKEDLDAACRLHPSLHGAFYTRGQAKFGLRDFKGAVKDFRRCLEVEPGRDEKKLKGLIAEAEGHEKSMKA